MDANLEESLDLVFGHEGGYSNRKSDAGGPTKYGITHRTLAAHRGVAMVTPDEVRNMSREEAAEIYRVGYWTQSGAHLLPSGLDYMTFDFGVNSGPSRAVRYLQKTVGVAQDGVLGPQTLAAVKAYKGGVRQLIKDYAAARMKFLRGLSSPATGFPKNGRGWTIRVTGKDPKGVYPDQPGVIGHALEMAENGGHRAPYAPVMEGVTVADQPESVNEPARPGVVDAWLKPETVLQAIPALGGLTAVLTGDGPLQIALGVALVLGAGVAAWAFVRRLREREA